MLTGVDYDQSSTIWAAQDKWKGIMKIKWIYVKDIPNRFVKFPFFDMYAVCLCKPFYRIVFFAIFD